MNTTKKSSLENSPYQNARTSLSEPKPRRSRSSSSKSMSSTRSARSSSASEVYGSANKPSTRSKGTSSRRSSERSGEHVSSRGPRRSTYSSSLPMDTKPPRRSPRIRSSSEASEPTRTLAEDAEILRRFKSLMQQSSDNSNAPVVSDPYPSYQVDEMGTVIHQKGANRPKAEVKVVVRRKRPLVNEGEEYENEDYSAETMPNDSEYLAEENQAEPQNVEQEAHAIDDNLLKAASLAFDQDNDHQPSKSRTRRSTKASTSVKKSKALEQESYADQDLALADENANVEQLTADEQEMALVKETKATTKHKAKSTRSTKTTAKSKAKTSAKSTQIDDEHTTDADSASANTDASVSDSKGESTSVSTSVSTSTADLSGVDDNLLRAAAIVFAQDPVMGVSKEQSLALGITANVADAILQEQTPGKKKKKKNKLTPAQKAEAEAAAAAAAAQEAAAIVALSKRFSGRKISQAESSLKAIANTLYEEPKSSKSYQATTNKGASNKSATQALLNKLAKTQAQLEKDDILPDSFDLDESQDLDDSQFAKAGTEESDINNSLSNLPYSSKSVTDIDNEFEDDDQILAPQTVKAAPKKTAKSSTTKSKEKTTVVETKSTILNGANDTAITIEVKRRTSKVSSSNSDETKSTSSKKTTTAKSSSRAKSKA